MKKKSDEIAHLRDIIRDQGEEIKRLSNGLRERIAQTIVGKNGYFVKTEADAMFAWIVKKKGK